MRCLTGAVLAFMLGSAAASRAQTPSEPPPAPAPIVVPTDLPGNPTTRALIRAAAGVVNDIINRNRLNAENTTRGTVDYFRHYDMQVQTGANSYRDVHLHPGTVINPRGATPGDGTAVDISGRGQSDGSLEADVVTVLR